MAAGATAIVAFCAAGYLNNLHRAPKLTPKDRIVLAEFENKTGDAVFDQTLRQGLAVQLEQSTFLTLVSDQSIGQAMHLMNLTLLSGGSHSIENSRRLDVLSHPGRRFPRRRFVQCALKSARQGTPLPQIEKPIAAPGIGVA